MRARRSRSDRLPSSTSCRSRASRSNRCRRSLVTGSVTEFRAGGPEFFFKAAAIHLDATLSFMNRSAIQSDGAAWISGASVEKLGVTVENGRAAEILAAALPFFVTRSA